MESLSSFAIAIIRAWVRQFSSALTSTTLLLRCDITGSSLPLHLIACLQKPKDILTEWTVKTNVSRALNLEFYCETLSKTLHITSPENFSFSLKLIPIGLSFWFNWIWIVISTISVSSTSRNACLKKSFTLARKCATGLLLSEGGIKRTASCLPTALYRLYSLVILWSTSNLRAKIFSLNNIKGKDKQFCRFVTYKHLYFTYHSCSLVPPTKPTIAVTHKRPPIYCCGMLTSFSCCFQSLHTDTTLRAETRTQIGRRDPWGIYYFYMLTSYNYSLLLQEHKINSN